MLSLLEIPSAGKTIPLPSRTCRCGDCPACDDRTARAAGRSLFTRAAAPPSVLPDGNGDVDVPAAPYTEADARWAAETAPPLDLVAAWAELRRWRETLHAAYEVGRGLGYSGQATPDVSRLEAEIAEAILVGWDRGDAEREIDDACAERYARGWGWHEDEARRARSNAGHRSEEG